MEVLSAVNYKVYQHRYGCTDIETCHLTTYYVFTLTFFTNCLGCAVRSINALLCHVSHLTCLRPKTFSSWTTPLVHLSGEGDFVI